MIKLLALPHHFFFIKKTNIWIPQTVGINLIAQQNYEKRYKYIVFALEAGLSPEKIIIYIQKSFLDNRSISHSGFHLY